MDLSVLYSKTRRAVEEFNMIESGDHVAVGISGGKDSLTLLQALAGLRHVKDFSLTAILIDLGFDGFSAEGTEKFCQNLSVPFRHIKSQISDVVFNQRNEKNPCSMCSKMRKGILNRTALEEGCNKVAYGHHRDDFINTFMMSMLYEGRLKTMEPMFFMSVSQLWLIRPMLYISEGEIIEFAKNNHLPVEKNPCPMDKNSGREAAQQLMKNISLHFPDSNDKIFSILKKEKFFIPKIKKD